MRRGQTPELRIGTTRSPATRGARLGLALLFTPLALISVLTTVFGNNGVIHLLQLRRQHEALSERAFRVVGHNKRLRRTIVRLRQDDTYLEAVARETLGLVREQEIVYRVPAPASGPACGPGAR